MENSNCKYVPKTNTAPLVLGILSIVFGILLPIVGLVIGIIGLILSVCDKKNFYSKFGTSGMILSIIGIVLSIIVSILIVIAIREIIDALNIMAQLG